MAHIADFNYNIGEAMKDDAQKATRGVVMLLTLAASIIKVRQWHDVKRMSLVTQLSVISFITFHVYYQLFIGVL